MDTEPYVALQTVMMPRDANPQGTIFGGVILGLIDMAAYVGAKRLVVRAGGPVPVLVTVAINRVEFHQPVFVGDEVSCYGRLVRTGRTSMTVRVEAWRRHLPSGEVRKVTEAIFTYVAIGEDRRPRPLPPAP